MNSRPWNVVALRLQMAYSRSYQHILQAQSRHYIHTWSLRAGHNPHSAWIQQVDPQKGSSRSLGVQNPGFYSLIFFRESENTAPSHTPPTQSTAQISCREPSMSLIMWSRSGGGRCMAGGSIGPYENGRASLPSESWNLVVCVRRDPRPFWDVKAL